MAPHLWFWTFWHWSTESVRTGALLRGPLEGIGGHWDEWYQHEATAAERADIAECGRGLARQRAFLSWLVRRWSVEASALGTPSAVRYVLGQLAPLAPFDEWKSLAPYRRGYGRAGVSAVVLSDESEGAATDVRRVEALLLPASVVDSRLIAEGFHADEAHLRAVREATANLLRGGGMIRLLATWLVAGRRPYARGLDVALGIGWVVTAALLIGLAVGVDPGEQLVGRVALLSGLWIALAAIGASTAAWAIAVAAREGAAMHGQLERSKLLLRMDGGLTLIGRSAGLAFALNAVAAIAGDRSRAGRSWMWRRLSRALRHASPAWAATGALDERGRVGAVVLAPKLKACEGHRDVRVLLVPRQAHDVRPNAPNAELHPPGVKHQPLGTGPTVTARLGFASEPSPLRTHAAHHLADALLTLARLTGMRPLVTNLFAVSTSLAMLAAFPGVRSVLFPPQAPVLVGARSASSYQLQLRLLTSRPDEFAVVLESGFWANRRVRLDRSPETPPVIVAELRLDRSADQTTQDPQDGVVYVQRRHRLFGREFARGELVGRYALASLVQSHD